MDDQEAFVANFNVPYETVNDLTVYRDLLETWNQRINLVGQSTLPLIWERHFADCAQLFDHIPPEARNVADMGAGAGFPGLVLAILAKHQKRDVSFYEIEATNKKADFLETVAQTLGLNVVVRRERIEDIRDLKADVVTARALKALPELFKYANYLSLNGTVCIFPKGQQALAELTAARKYWTFGLTTYPSRSDASGMILVIKDLRYKTRR